MPGIQTKWSVTFNPCISWSFGSVAFLATVRRRLWSATDVLAWVSSADWVCVIDVDIVHDVVSNYTTNQPAEEYPLPAFFLSKRSCKKGGP